MAFPIGNRKMGFVSAPRAQAAAGPPGQVVAVTVSAAASYIGLAAGISQAVLTGVSTDDPAQVIRNYVTIECDVDLAIVFGPTAAAVSAGNAPVIATVGTLAAGVYTPAAGTAFVLYAKNPLRILLQNQVDLFMGFVAAGAGTLRMYQSSPDNV